MHLAKLIKVLKSLDAPRFRSLVNYIHSPYFKIYPPSATLFNYLAKLYPAFSEKKITVPLLSAHNQNLSTLKKQETASVRLMRAIEKFIAIEQWQKNEASVTQHHLAGLKELQLTDQFDLELKKQTKRLANDTEHHFDTFFEKHLLTELSFNGFNARLNRTSANDLLPIITTLDEFHALKKLRYLCEALNRQQFLGIRVPLHQLNIPALLQTLQPYNSPQYPYVYLFTNVYHLLRADNYEDSDLYYQLIKQFASRQTTITDTLREAMGYAINHTLHWYNKGFDEAGTEYLWWIEWRSENNILFDHNQLMPVTFRNMLTMGISSNKSRSWFEKIINTYATHLPEPYYATHLAFARGLQNYASKQYLDAIRFLLMAEAKEAPAFNCIIRRWQFICLYEFDPDDVDGLSNQLLAFEKYLRRHKTDLQHLHASFHLFTAYATKLLKASGKDMPGIHLTRLATEEHFTGKPWLQQQYRAKSKTKPLQVATM